MIIIDLNQIFMSNLHAGIGKNTQVDENLIRHMILNSIRVISVSYKSKYGQIVIACDARNNWRKQIFPYYKIRRKKSRDDSSLNWEQIFTIFTKIKEELRYYVPYPVIEVDTAEADDVIGVLVKKISVTEPVLIVSGDKDFIQLHNDNVFQYDPVRKKTIHSEFASDFLVDQLITGDPGDDVPNILSDDNCFALNKRQVPITAKKRATLGKMIYHNDLTNMSENIKRNLARNKQLIDLSSTPKDLSDTILKVYEEQKNKPKGLLLSYFIDKRMKLMMEHLSDF